MTVVADEHVGLSSAHLGQLVFSDGLFGQSLSDLLQLCTRHLLREHTRTHTPCSEKIKWPESVPSRSYQTRTSCPGRHFKPKEQETHSTRGSFGLLFWNLCCLNMQILPLPQWAWSCYTFLSGRSSFSWVFVQAPEKIPTETLVLTSALMLAMRWGAMFPRRTFRRSSGFFWSFRLEIRLRRRVLYFISVDLNSW